MDGLLSNDFTSYMYAFFWYLLQSVANEIMGQEACHYDPNITFFKNKIIIEKYKPELLPNFGCPFFNEIALLAYKDASLLKQSLLLYLQKWNMFFSTKLLHLDVIALTLSWKLRETLFTFCAVFTCNYLPLSTKLTKLLRFKLNQITRKKSERTSLTMHLRWEIFFRPTRKAWLNQAYRAFTLR